jgi:hypothetical protein
MEFRTSEINKQNYAKTSPYQELLSTEGRSSVVNQFKGKLLFIWLVPIGLTFAEIVFLKYNKSSSANRISLAKWTSYILATVASNFSSAEALRKCEYYNRLYPNAPKIQKEHVRDAEIYQRTVKL